MWEESFNATFNKELSNKDKNINNKRENKFNENELLEKYVERSLDHELITFE